MTGQAVIMNAFCSVMLAWQIHHVHHGPDPSERLCYQLRCKFSHSPSSWPCHPFRERGAAIAAVLQALPWACRWMGGPGSASHLEAILKAHGAGKDKGTVLSQAQACCG